MKMITSQDDFDNAGSRDLILIECSFCHKPYKKVKHLVQADIKHNNKIICSKECYSKSKLNGQTKPCSHCGSPVNLIKLKMATLEKVEFSLSNYAPLA